MDRQPLWCHPPAVAEVEGSLTSRPGSPVVSSGVVAHDPGSSAVASAMAADAAAELQVFSAATEAAAAPTENCVLFSATAEGSVGQPCLLSTLREVSFDSTPTVESQVKATHKSLSKEDIVRYGGIEEPVSKGIRSSARLSARPDGDTNSLERAMLMAQRRNDLRTSGKSVNRKLSFLELPTDEIVRRASKLGVSLGKSPVEVSNAVFGIKQVEESRALTILKNSLNNLDENSEQSLVMRNAYNLSEDLGEEDDEPLLDQMGLITEKVSAPCRRGKNKGTGLVVQRRSARIEKIRKSKQ